MTAPLSYGDISPRTAAYAVAQMLKRGVEELILEKFGQAYVVPTKSTKVAKFRRYNVLALATTPVVEGVTPSGKKLTITDYTATLQQYGDWVPFTDIIEDTIEDPFLQELTGVLSQQANETIEQVRYNTLKAGTNVFYANGSSRTDVNTVITLTLQRKVTRALKRQRGKHLTTVVASDARFRTEPIEAAFIGVCHSDMENDIRNMSGFINTKQYGTVTAWANEIGSVEDVRYIRSTLFVPFTDGGGSKGSMISTGGTYADVYPVLYIAKDAYGIVPLKGKNSLSIAVVNPKPVHGDPLGQRGSASWKTMQTACILNDAWIARLECAATN